jgi:2-iminoacetate synthase
MSFETHLDTFSWKEVQDSIYAKTALDVERALSSAKPTLEDFKALVSPAAGSYLEQMAQLSYTLTRKRFGKTIQLYIPLYLSNICQNRCVYCGFNAENKIPRKRLSIDEVMREVEVIKHMGYQHVLLVTGEAPSRAGMSYFREVFKAIRPYFAQISVEVQPLEQFEYAELMELGLHAVYIYQETYNKQHYERYHLGGRKQDFSWRLSTPERLGKAGVHKIGLGILAGLEDWRTDSFFCASHLKFLSKHFWRTRYSIAFPRLRPHQGGFEPQNPVSEAELLQLMCAYRILDSEVELSLSTRESASYRNNVMKLGVTTMSAGSKTEPGGYAEEYSELEQFAVNDNRTAAEIERVIKGEGFEAIWKDWDSYL